MQVLPLRARRRVAWMLVLATLGVGGCAQSPPAAMKADSVKPSLPKILEAYRFLLLSETKVCSSVSSSCTVEVKMSKLVDGTDTYCLAEVPEKIVFPQTRQGNQTKTIVWKLVPKDSSFNLAVEFQEDFGILVLKNDKSQIVKGGWGNGGGGTQRTEYHMKNEHKKTGSSVYLPIVLQMGAPGEDPKMCAAADPKIINE